MYKSKRKVFNQIIYSNGYSRLINGLLNILTDDEINRISFNINGKVFVDCKDIQALFKLVNKTDIDGNCICGKELKNVCTYLEDESCEIEIEEWKKEHSQIIEK